MIEEGAKAIDALRAASPNINFDEFKTIRMILDSVDALDNKENRMEFLDYLLACSVKDLHRRNAANLRQQYELREMIETLKDELVNLTDKEKIKASEKRIAKLNEELKVLKNSTRRYTTPHSHYLPTRNQQKIAVNLWALTLT